MGKVPVIELPDGKILYESLIVSDYFDEISKPRRLRPVDYFQKALDRLWTDKFGKVCNMYFCLT